MTKEQQKRCDSMLQEIRKKKHRVSLPLIERHLARYKTFYLGIRDMLADVTDYASFLEFRRFWRECAGIANLPKELAAFNDYLSLVEQFNAIVIAEMAAEPADGTDGQPQKKYVPILITEEEIGIGIREAQKPEPVHFGRRDANIESERRMDVEEKDAAEKEVLTEGYLPPLPLDYVPNMEIALTDCVYSMFLGSEKQPALPDRILLVPRPRLVCGQRLEIGCPACRGEPAEWAYPFYLSGIYQPPGNRLNRLCQYFPDGRRCGKFPDCALSGGFYRHLLYR